MIDTIYIEEDIQEHPRVQEICQRFQKARTIPCHHYGEVFNRHNQNFRLQKKNPALILARKNNRFLHVTPEGYGIGGDQNYYFSHMLNCIYDCRYCFLQGMYRSAHYLLFVNFEDFQGAITEKIKEEEGKPLYFFSGYDCDSLALDSVTHFISEFLDFFAEHPQAYLELRTKSVQTKSLLSREAMPNCIVAFSFTPQEISQEWEAKVPPLKSRLAAVEKLQKQGWPIGLRFDPLIFHSNFQKNYEELFALVFSRLEVESIHSVSLGPFRLPKPIYQRMHQLYPDEKLFAVAMEERNKMISYEEDKQEEMINFCTKELLKHIPERIFFPCTY